MAPQAIKCPSCGATHDMLNPGVIREVCEQCGSRPDVSGTAREVVGRKTDRQPFFPFQLGDAFHDPSDRFEVIARLADIEDGDVGEMPRANLLYPPRRPSLWLG